ncbi:MAG: hypothetical protein ACXVJW_11935 [Acidimicrobiia bacterium]
MALIVGFVVVGLVCAIAAVFVFREAARMSEQPPAAIFDPDDAYDWVVRHLPDLVASTLTPEDVRRILDFQLEFFKRKGVSSNGSGIAPQGAVIFGTGETIEYILERSAETGESYLPEQVEGVVECQLAYLRFIGAVGRAAGPDEPRPDEGDPSEREGRGPP